MAGIPWLATDSLAFPDLDAALDEPEGLLAAGGDLSCERLVAAYRQGIFPWYSQGQPLLWWSPNPRCVLYPDAFHRSRSLRRALRQPDWRLSFDRDFAAVIRACALERADEGTWITPEMEAAYNQLHAQGLAHSVEVWKNDELAGGLYGLALGRIFFGESMFSRVTNASKVALYGLCQRLLSQAFILLDCQVRSDHLVSLGACELPRATFASLVRAESAPVVPDHWRRPGWEGCADFRPLEMGNGTWKTQEACRQ